MNAREQLAAAGKFNLNMAKAASAERIANGVMPKNLKRRIKDYALMIAQKNIGDGHRDVNGYTKPGSNKK